MSTPGGDETLPKTAEETHRVRRVTLAPTAIDPTSAETEFRRLHSLLAGESGHTQPATLEVRLQTTAEGIDYTVGIDDESRGIDRFVERVFPDSYEHTEALAADHDCYVAEGTQPVGVEFLGAPERRRDWQTRLTPFAAFDTEADHRRLPLAALVETMAEASVPMVFQCLLRPRADWTLAADERRLDIEANQDTLSGKVLNSLLGRPDPETVELTESERQRIAEITERDTRHCFEVTLRVLALPRHRDDAAEAEACIRDVQTVFSEAGQTTNRVEAVSRDGEAAETVLAALLNREPSKTRRFRATRAVVADPSEVGTLCLLDGTSLTTEARRALGVLPGERTAVPAPPEAALTAYRGPGLTLGRPVEGGTPAEACLGVPPALQPLHTAWFGKTGSGKSTALLNAMLDNHTATDGASILIDPKGDGMPEEYMRAHFARYGSLENVYYFDCARVLPAFSFFDIRADLDAGVARTTAVEDRTDHYIEILTQLMGRDRFEQAVRSPDVIRYLVKAMFDPINGADAFSHRDLHGEARRMHERQSAPPVSDDDLEAMLGGLVANRARTFDEIMAGVANRLEKIPVDQRLARVFNHVPHLNRAESAPHAGVHAEGEDPHFDLGRYLDDDVVVIFDTGGLRSEAQRVLSLVILSNLWSALRRRKRLDSDAHPLVNVYVEEAASIAVSQLLKRLLSQSRGFDCALTLAMQFPAQLRESDTTAYEEVLNNVSTIVTGNVAVDHRLAERMATDDMPASDVGTRLRALRRGQWLCALPSGFDDPEPRPFVLASAPLPPGHPDAPETRTEADHAAYQRARDALDDRTLDTVGLTVAVPSAADETDAEAPDPRTVRVDSALPHTRRLPPTVEYEATTHALRCTECDSRYDPSDTGMGRAIACCSSLDAVERDDIPICALNLKLSPEEREASEWSDHQLMFLQAVYNAQQRRYDPPGYDLLYDSMLRLQEYVGIDADAVDDLCAADCLRHDSDHPHRLYSVTATGRQAIGEGYRQGVDFGHGKGDLDESSLHVLTVEVGRRYLQSQYVADPESPVVDVVPYYELDGSDTTAVPASLAMGGDSGAVGDAADAYNNRRLDVAGLDSEGAIVVALEAERINHDAREAIPADFDKMAACNPEEAIWVVTKQSDGHAVLDALRDPPDGVARVEKTYAKTTPPQQFRIDTPGLTAVYPVDWLRDRIE